MFAALLFVIGAGCEPYQEARPRRDRLNFPIGLAMHPDGRYLYVVNSNFDARFDPELGGTVSVVDTKLLRIRPESSPYIPSFGGKIKINPSKTRAYVTARKDNTLVVFDIANTADGGVGSALTCPNENGVPSSDPARCSIRRVPDTADGGRIPEDPFDLDVHEITAGGNTFDLVSMSHVRGTQISALSVPEGSLSGVTLANAPIVNGSTAIARRPGTREIYAAGLNESRVAISVPFINASGEAEAIFARGSVRLDSAANAGGRAADARAIDFSADGKRMYVATRAPDALYVFNISPSDDATGRGVDHQLSQVIPLGDQPSDLVVHQDPIRGEVVMVTCFADRSIQVVDPKAGVILNEIELDSDPYDIVIDTSPGQCEQPGQPCRAYVSLFSDGALFNSQCDPAGAGCGSIAVIDLEPGSDREFQVVAKIR